MTRGKATAIGFSAILMWSLLALLTVGSHPVPPLQLNAICFTLGGLIGLGWTGTGRGISILRRMPAGVYLFGALGLFGYHFLYFSALRAAPAAEAGLIAYLWPLFIVLLSGLLPGERLRAGHVVGAVVSLAGVALLLMGNGSGFAAQYVAGYALAFGCALTWSSYSVLSRRFGGIPTESVTVFCLLAAVFSFGAHLVLEQTVWPVSPVGWLAVAALGAGPVGLAFFVWDVGVKNGDIQLLGVASYAAPLLSTLILVTAGIAEPRWQLLAAAGLIVTGAGLAARASGMRRTTQA